MNIAMQAQGISPESAPLLNSSRSFELKLVQQPLEGRNVSPGQRSKGSKWPIDPPPVLELVGLEKDPNKWIHLHNPNWFCSAALIEVELVDKNRLTSPGSTKDNMTGQLVSSLHKVKSNQDKTEHGYFAFGDLNIRDLGKYQLKFTLFEIRYCPDTHMTYASEVHSVVSDVFKVHAGRNPENPRVSSELSKALSEAGVKIRIRKEATKRRAYQADWSSQNSRDSLVRPNMLAPMVNNMANNMAPPPQNSRTSRSIGIDVSSRISTKNEPLTPSTETKPQPDLTVFEQYPPNQLQTSMTSSRGGQMAYTNNMFSHSPISMAPAVNYSPTAAPYYSISHEQPNAWAYDHNRAGTTAQSIGEVPVTSPQAGIGDRPPYKRMRDQEYNMSIPPPFHTGHSSPQPLPQNNHAYGNYVPTTSAPPQEIVGHIGTFQPNPQSQVTQAYQQYGQNHPMMSQIPFTSIGPNYPYTFETPYSGTGHNYYST